jgi:hypothetical protein
VTNAIEITATSVTNLLITLRPAACYAVSAILQQGPPDRLGVGGLLRAVGGISPQKALYSTQNRPR